MIYKICTYCNQEKDETHFNKHKLGKFGLNPVYRNCNTALGHVKENADILYAMIRYIEEH